MVSSYTRLVGRVTRHIPSTWEKIIANITRVGKAFLQSITFGYSSFKSIPVYMTTQDGTLTNTMRNLKTYEFFHEYRALGLLRGIHDQIMLKY